ncbi:MAG: hypothetical protein OES09_13215 [Gammaproteobacteria bacterium]|nr:hypothetical protein [Gammaproteobacteria bacterium]
MLARSHPEITPSITLPGTTPLTRSILEVNGPWENETLTPSNIPGMLTESDKKYYMYITRYLRGFGEVVEVGPWLGCSTFHILTGLRRNTNFSGKRLHVYDDFVWRSDWMNKWLSGTSIQPPPHLTSFRELFERNLDSYKDLISVFTRKLSDSEGNEHLPAIEWNGGDIELCFIDCGRTMEQNIAWYRVLESAFISGKTLIVMQDWQMHKAVPVAWWENIKLFTDRFSESLDLIHEVRGSGIGTFIYRGT